MQFDNVDEILEILLCSDKSFKEIEDYCNRLSPAIKSLHKNSLGNEYPSSYTQCILECYKLKYNFISTTWYSDKLVDKNLVKANYKPIEFSRINSKGDILKYILYNGDSIDNSNCTNNTKLLAQKTWKDSLSETCLDNVDIDEFKNFKLRYLILSSMKFNTFTRYARDIDFFIERFGLLSGNVLTLEEIGNQNSLTGERVRQIIERAFRKFKYKILKATFENSPEIFKLARYLEEITNIIDIKLKEDSNFSLENFIKDKMGNYSPIYIKLLNKLTNKNYTVIPPKFNNLQDALDSLDNVIKLYDKKLYSADFIADVLEIKNRKAIVANKEVNLPLNNFLYVYSTKRKNIFYKNICGIGYLSKNVENLNNIEKILSSPSENKIPTPNIEKKNSKIKKAILSCIKEFSGKYGKTGIAKILKGSKAIKDNAYNKTATSSLYYGMFEQLTLSFIEKEIDKLIDEDYLEIKKVNYGHPLLLTNAKAESYIDKNIEEVRRLGFNPTT